MNRGGGGQGRGKGGGAKRKPNTPVGGAYKDQRRNINSDEMGDEEDEEEWTEVQRNRRSPQHNQQLQQQEEHEQEREIPPSRNVESDQETQSRPTFASVAAQQASSSL